MSDHDTHWSAKADWMREAGATEAAWATTGELVHLKLGPQPSPDGDDDYNPVESRSPVELEQAAREERRRLILASSGGPVKRLGSDD